MAVRTRSRYRYTSDNGRLFSVILADDIGGEAGFGFTAADGTEAGLPQGAKMRYAMLNTPDGSRSFTRPVGTLTAAAWATPTVGSYALDQWDEVGDVTVVVTSTHGESFEYGTRPIPI